MLQKNSVHLSARKRVKNSCGLMDKKSIKKIFLPVIMLGVLFIIKPSGAQVICEISIDTPPPVCYDNFFELSVLEQPGVTYYWSPTGDTTSNIVVKITEPTDFTVTVIDTVNHDTCVSEPYHVDVRPEIKVTFEQLQLTCTNGDEDNGNTAQVKATAGDAYPPDEYHYFWDVHPIQIAPGDSSLAMGLKAYQNYIITVKDNYGCSTVDTFYTKAYYNPDIEIVADPDTLYLENPHGHFSFINHSEDSVQVTNSFWEFDKDDNSYSMPELDYTFRGDSADTYTVYLTVYNQQGCDTVYTAFIDVLPVNLLIPNVFTPNGDGINDTFIISEQSSTSGGGNQGGTKSISAEYDNYKPINVFYEGSELVVFNRYGRVVYKSSNYQNDWDGGNLPDGTYFYVLKCHGFKTKKAVYKGSVAIFRGNK